MTRSITRLSGLLRPLAALALSAPFLAGCGDLVDMGGSRKVDPRRVYLNDPARNDSLAAAASGRGLMFVLQPGESYALRMMKSGGKGDRLDFYHWSGSSYTLHESVTGVRQGDLVTFPLAPTKSVASSYLAFLRSAEGGRATSADSLVRLVPLDTAGATSLAVRLLMVRRLYSHIGPGYMDAAEKSLYARSFNIELRAVFAGYGISVDTATWVVEPDGDPFTADFRNVVLDIPGERRPDAINIYLVDDIVADDVGGTILGFAPREAFDLYQDSESRVILNVRGGSANAMAVTAAHEIGHFLGLRHTSATLVDREYDDDESNRDDGFATTGFCGVLQKPAAPGGDAVIRVREGRPYCLRVAAPARFCGRCGSEEYNLMFPYACEASTQKTLGADQQKFLRNNLRVFQ